MGHDLGDQKVRDKWGFFAFRSVGSLVSLIQLSKQIKCLRMFSYEVQDKL